MRFVKIFFECLEVKITEEMWVLFGSCECQPGMVLKMQRLISKALYSI